MKKIIYLLIILLPIISVAQEPNRAAILIYKLGEGNKFTSLVQNKLIKTADAEKDINFYIYNWNGAGALSFYPGKQKEESAITHVNFLSLNTEVEENPPLIIETDTSGKTKAAYFPIRPVLSIASKSIELKTSQIVDYSVNRFTQNPSTSGFNASPRAKTDIYIDFIKEFGTDPAILRKQNYKEFEKAEAKVKEKFRNEIEKRLINIFDDWGKNVSSKISDYKGIWDNKYFSVIKDGLDLEDDKIKTIKSTATVKDGFKIDDYLNLYEVIKFDNYSSTRFINYFKIKSIDEKQSELDLYLFGSKKKLAAILKEGNELILTNSSSVLNDYNRKLNKIQNTEIVSVKKDCFFCETDLELNLMTVPSIKLVERAANELNYFRNLAKSEKFIDLVDGDDQYKQLGVKYLFYSENKTLKSTDIETGRIIGSETSQGKFLGMSVDNSNSPIVIKTLFLDTFNKEIQILSYSQETKNRVKEIIIASPFGILEGERFKIYAQEEEDVNGKKVKRNSEIGQGIVSRTMSNLVAKMSVTDGEKDFFEAKKQGKTIVIKYRLSK